MIRLKSGPRMGEIALFYACDSLARQITKWARKHPGYAVKCSFARLLPEIRAQLERADLAVIDATEDPAQACDAFSQAVGQLGVASTGMYSEDMPADLEEFVRSRRPDVVGADGRCGMGWIF